MNPPKTLSASSEYDMMALVEQDLYHDDLNSSYYAILKNDYQDVELFVDHDYGAGYSASLEVTALRSALQMHDEFTFSVRNKTIFDRIKQFFGKRYIETGINELDKNVVIRSNQPDKLIEILDNPEIISVLKSLEEFNFSININEAITNKNFTLELNINNISRSAAKLKDAYHMFNIVNAKVQHYQKLMNVINMAVLVTTSAAVFR
jgi:hypothetical protein